MTDYLPILVGVLLAVTLAAALEYYRQIRRAKREYERAKGAVEEIILSVNRELKREAGKLDSIEFRIAGNAGRTDSILKMVDILEKKFLPFETQVKAVVENSSDVVFRLTEVDERIHSVETSNQLLRAKVEGFEEKMQKLSEMPEVKSEPVITIRRDKAIGSLTDTEISVLEMLSTEGPKTAPEIKEKVRLSREHTARLMKKLYESGYLERETNKIPFKYSIKKEMEMLLRKPEESEQA